MVEPGGHAQRGDSSNDIVRAPRRIRQQDDSLVCFDKQPKAVDCVGDLRDPVMDDAPKIEDKPAIARRQLAQTGNQMNRHTLVYSEVMNANRLALTYNANIRSTEFTSS